MPVSGRFTRQQLQAIIEQAAIYFCACPAQLCEQLLHLADLYQYQEQCLERGDNGAVHEEIATATQDAYRMLEDCLDRILTIEGWDRQTLRMPDGLRRLRDEAV